MAVQVSTGAQVECSFGAAPAVFSASGENVAATTAAGVVTDVEEENIPSFGMCSAPTNPDVMAATAAALGTLTPAPCVPVLSPWTPGALRVTVNGVAALGSDSKCMCDWAGVIQVIDPGQERVTIA
ncbi:MAG TPA: DUF4280 domain-containing protein [Trebonia sp.]|jgi:hypothetical protein|nr:DUF4280 domain-containing protein [Trebonia sp.]